MSSVSIIIPVYNVEKYLDKCVESIVSQNYTDLEIILVNDGSTDASGAICDSWAEKDSRIKVIHKENGGVSSARNAGLDNAEGSYIIFADAYSRFEADSLGSCMAEIEAHMPDLLVCAVKAPQEDKRSKIYMDCNMYTRYEYNENIARYISTGLGFDSVTNKIFSRSYIDSCNMRFAADMPLVAQQLFNCRYFALAGHIRCTSQLLNSTSEAYAPVTEGTTEYLAQGKVYSQKLIDAVQSKGLYNIASRAIGENYQKILYTHLLYLAKDSSEYSLSQRLSALEQLAQTADSGPLMLYLSTLGGIKNRYIYQLYKLRSYRLLLSFLGK